ncbi:MAG TPA: pitrilysin family protein [Gemmatimonadaceae bacterium]
MTGPMRFFTLLFLAPAALSAQVPQPGLAPAAPLGIPAVRSSVTPNGIQLRVVEQHELPLVQVTLTVTGGSRLDDRTPGVATFMAGMLDEGAGTRDALALQSELAYLGANLSTTADWDRFTVGLKVPLRALPAALALMSDVVLRPTFQAEEVRRQRDLRLTGLLQARDQPNTLAGLAFNQVVYPASHPYARSALGDSVTVAAYDSALVRRFYEGAMRPDRASLFVVGDITEAQVRTLVEQHFGAWRATGAAIPLPAPPAAITPTATTRVWLVDKPEAAQSVIMIGWPGVERTSPDYAALQVMNTLLGGSFTSRLNMNLRETKGYSYGAGSGFSYRVVPGPFIASSSVRTNVTDSSLVEIFKELRGVRDVAVPEDELNRAKAYVELGIPGTLESTSQVAGQMALLATFGLTLDELPRLAARVRAVTAADVQRVAREYLTPDRAHVVVVGDLAKVKTPIEQLGLGTATTLEVSKIAR